MTSLSREDIQELLPLYVMDEVSVAEREQIERALATDTKLSAEADRWREDCGRMLEASTPPMLLSDAQVSQLRQRLISALPKTSEARPSTPEPPIELDQRRQAAGQDPASGWMQPLALAASLLSLAVAFWALSGRTPRAALESELQAMRVEREQMGVELDQLRAALERTDSEIERVSLSLKTFGYPRSEPIVLAGLDPAPQALGATFYRPSSQQALFYAFGLPELPADTVYQLWYITDSGPASAGTFEVDGFGEGEVLVADVPAGSLIDLWAVTVEPAGGSAQPTGAMMIRG